MVRKAFLMVLATVLAVPVAACAHVVTRDQVDVRIVSDSRGELGKYATYPRVPREGRYFYVEAVKGERYGIQVANRSGRRIGVVIAVDGRNIITGDKSDLKPSERMYIIGPYETNTFEGWRTGMDRTNRFYFTEQADSYAERVFADGSAMGTIALAAYMEKLPDIIYQQEKPLRMKEAPAGAAPSATDLRAADRLGAKSEQAGTGFGETTHSPVRVVTFEPERAPFDRVVMKYEWQSELCRKGLMSCGPKSRLWPGDHELAPIPRDFRG